MRSDNLNRYCTVIHRVGVSIQHTDFQAVQVNMCMLVDAFVLHNVHFLHTNQYHRLYGTHDSIDRKLRHPNNPHCIGKFHVHMISMDCLEFQPGICN